MPRGFGLNRFFRWLVAHGENKEAKRRLAEGGDENEAFLGDELRAPDRP